MGKYGLLGERLSHSFSPQIHARLAGYDYKLYEKTPDEVEGFLRAGAYTGAFDGLNVTIPYKRTAFGLCDMLSEDAQKIGSVNTIIRTKDGTLHGDNTDYYGFSYLLGKAGVDVGGKKALVLGSGGASLTVCAVLRDIGAGEVVVISRTGEDNYANLNRHSDAFVIVNTTPVGMYPENGASPVALGAFPACGAVLDVIYNPAKTELLLQAEDLGIVCAGGIYMLVAQAKRAAELFLGREIPNEKIDAITKEILMETKNVALIGMPGSGKSTVGYRLAQLTGREFFDTDELIVSKAGKSIERIFAQDGEDAFRNLETEVLGAVSARCGCVIATGGGIVKRAVNRRLLRQNSVTVLLDRKPGELPVNGRPLSISQGVEALYRERLPLYTEWSDCTVRARSSVEETAGAIKEALVKDSRLL